MLRSAGSLLLDALEASLRIVDTVRLGLLRVFGTLVRGSEVGLQTVNVHVELRVLLFQSVIRSTLCNET